MGLFDGVVAKFADKLCEYINGRIVMLTEQATKSPGKTQQEAFDKLRWVLTASVLEEVVLAIKTVRDQ